MALYSLATGASIQALDVTQFYNLLTGVMTDQPVTLGNILSVSPGTYRGALGVGTSSPNYYGYTNASVETVYGGTAGGVLELVSTAADASGASAGTLAFEAIMNAGHEVRVADIIALTDGTTAGNRGGDLALRTKADGGALTERMRIMQNGNVGVGTNAPNVIGFSGGSLVGTLLASSTGASGGGVLELGTTGAEAVGTIAGYLTFIQTTMSGEKRLGAVYGISAGSAAGNHQGDLVFATKADGAAQFSLAEHLRVTGSGHLVVTGASPALGPLQPGVSAQSISGTDIAMRLSITFTASPVGAGGVIAVVNFALAYVNAPRTVWSQSAGQPQGINGYNYTPSSVACVAGSLMPASTTITIDAVAVGV